jgi:uncharacterized protein involved in exopolysaccharide biosynthesis
MKLDQATEDGPESALKLEELAAWYRIRAERAGAAWVWEARLRAAQELDDRARQIRSRLKSHEAGADKHREQHRITELSGKSG